MVDGESVQEVIKDGPFTLLHLDNRAGSGYITSTHLSYYRILYRDRVFVSKVERAAHWAAIGFPAFFAETYGENGVALNVVHEVAGKPVVHHIQAADSGWRGEEGYEYGYPIDAGRLYFPPNAGTIGNGFLLSAVPFNVRILPSVVKGGTRGPGFQNLASISPDGKSVAFVDDDAVPEAIMVSDDDGVIHDPRPVPIENIGSLKNDANFVSRLMRWGSIVFEWKPNSSGKWDVARRSRAHRADLPENPVEELFLDAERGYQMCFAPDSASCVRGWRRLIDNDTRMSISDGYNPGYAYLPPKATLAFGANIRRLHSSFARRANYALVLDASVEKVTAELTVRLEARKIPFVRSDECPRTLKGELACAKPLNEQMGWQLPIEPALLQLIEDNKGYPPIFVLPTLALTIQSAADGTTSIETLARYAAGYPRTSDGRYSDQH